MNGAIARSCSGLNRVGVFRQMSNIADGGLGRRWRNKEAAEENRYFNKEEEEVLKRLASKISKHAEPTPEQLESDASRVQKILSKHGVDSSTDLVDEILSVKYGKDH